MKSLSGLLCVLLLLLLLPLFNQSQQEPSRYCSQNFYCFANRNYWTVSVTVAFAVTGGALELTAVTVTWNVPAGVGVCCSWCCPTPHPTRAINSNNPANSITQRSFILFTFLRLPSTATIDTNPNSGSIKDAYSGAPPLGFEGRS